MSEEKRSEPRTPKRKGVRYSLDGGRTVRLAATRDLSESGLGLVVREQVAVGTLLVAWLPKDADDTEVFPVVCEVRSCRPFEVRGNFRVGILFMAHDKNSDRYRQELTRTISAIKERERAQPRRVTTP